MEDFPDGLGQGGAPDAGGEASIAGLTAEQQENLEDVGLFVPICHFLHADFR